MAGCGIVQTAFSILKIKVHLSVDQIKLFKSNVKPILRDLGTNKEDAKKTQLHPSLAAYSGISSGVVVAVETFELARICGSVNWHTKHERTEVTV